jgi:hypothetical protein
MADLSSGWPVAYLIATLIFAVGLIIGAMTHVSQPVDVVEKTPSSEDSIRSPDLKTPSVGRITGLVGCKGTDALARAVCGDEVHLGGKYTLSTGLMEIAYDSGAKVILQGPVMYEVESATGGYLSVGKLTAKLEKKSEVRGQRSESASQKSEIGNHQFSVRTPTALITDLGTEFGVEVSRQDGTHVCVLQGRVALQPLAAATTESVVLEKGQSSRVDAHGKLVRTSDTETASHGKRFVRQMPAQSVNRIAYTWQIGVPGTFAVANNDLINAGQPSLTGIDLTFGTAEWRSGIGKLIDGKTYGPGALRERPEQDTEDTFNPSDGATVTVALNTTDHPQGYDVQSIVVLTGSSGRRGQERGWLPQDRSSQRFDLAYSLASVPDRFVTLQGDKKATVDRDAQGYPEMQVTISSGGKKPIASGVAKLRFTFHNTESSDPESMYREIDVLGAATGEMGGAKSTVLLSH